MESKISLFLSWLSNSRVGYHKHDNWPDHPVGVLNKPGNHESYFKKHPELFSQTVDVSSKKPASSVLVSLPTTPKFDSTEKIKSYKASLKEGEEERIKEDVDRIFGKSLSTRDIQNIFSSPLKKYSSVITSSDIKTGLRNEIVFKVGFQDSKGAPSLFIKYTFSHRPDGLVTVHRSAMLGSSNAMKEDRLHIHVQKHTENQLKDIGIREITMDTSKATGYLAALYGYDFARPIDHSRILRIFAHRINSTSSLNKGTKERLRMELKGLSHSWELAAWNPFNEPYGKHFGKEAMMGSSWRGSKDLSDASEGYKRGLAYYETLLESKGA